MTLNSFDLFNENLNQLFFSYLIFNFWFFALHSSHHVICVIAKNTAQVKQQKTPIKFKHMNWLRCCGSKKTYSILFEDFIQKKFSLWFWNWNKNVMKETRNNKLKKSIISIMKTRQIYKAISKYSGYLYMKLTPLAIFTYVNVYVYRLLNDFLFKTMNKSLVNIVQYIS